MKAQAMTDVVTVTAGGVYDGPTSAGFWAGRYGSVTPGVTTNGYTYQQIINNGPFTRKGFSSPAEAQIAVAGLTADPGRSWLQVSITHGAPPLGYLDLKYVIVAVDYAPPGSRSSVTYSNTQVRGTASTDEHSYKTEVEITNTGDIGVNIFGIVSGGLTASTDVDYQQLSDNSSSVTVTNTTMVADQVPGPGSSSLGVDHDFDVIWVWLNPAAAEYVGTNTVSFAGYGYNAQDDFAGAEIVPIQVEQLQISDSYTITDKWSSAINSTVGKTASYSITGPQASDNYIGPVSFQVYRDNVYGSFMFYPL